MATVHLSVLNTAPGLGVGAGTLLCLEVGELCLGRAGPQLGAEKCSKLPKPPGDTIPGMPLSISAVGTETRCCSITLCLTLGRFYKGLAIMGFP